MHRVANRDLNFQCNLNNNMITFDSQTVILAVVGMIGLIATATITTYAFKRNRTGTGQY